MFLPPDPRNVRTDIPTAEPKPPQTLRFEATAWAVLAGVAFGAARFLAVLYWLIEIAHNPPEPGWHGMAEVVWGASITATIFAALGGGVFWRRFNPPLSNGQGAVVGLVAAACGYAGVALFAGANGLLVEGDAVSAAFMSIFCGVASAAITSSIVVPVLLVLGIALSAVQRVSFPKSQADIK